MNLLVAEQLKCDEGIFLSPILRAHENDGLNVGPETLLAVRGLKKGIQQLRTSNDPHIQTQLADINDGYFVDDGIWLDEVSLTGWKPGRNLLGNLQRANAGQVVQFAELYDERVRELQQALHVDRTKLADDAMQRTHKLIGKNILPKTADELMQQTINWAGKFEAIGSVEQAANSNIGYCYDGGIGIANLYELPYFPSVPGVLMHQTVFHEYVHGIGHLQNNKRGIFFGLTDKLNSNYNRWLEEAYVATIAHEAVKPDIKQTLIQPAQSYGQERRFMKLLLDVAASPVDLADLSAAHFSYRSPQTKARQHITHALGSALNDIFPEYDGLAWEHINQNYEQRSDRNARSNYIGRITMTAQKRLSAECLKHEVA